MKENQTLELAQREPQQLERKQPTTLEILDAAIRGGVSSENVAVVKEIIAMKREEEAAKAKSEFNKAFFRLCKDLPVIYADKEVKTKSGQVAFEYCSPDEIKSVLQPAMRANGFCTMTGQTLDDGRVTATVTLMHEAGHSESRSFTVRVSPGNSLMSPSQCDAGASTSAERHCLIKMFQLRTRNNPDDDPRNEGDPNAFVTAEQAFELERRVNECGADIAKFLAFAGAKQFGEIRASKYDELDRNLRIKEQAGR